MVSVIIPTYNDTEQLEHIATCALKVKEVTEVIIVNDGSSPEHTQKLQKIKNIKLINHNKNKGKCAAMKTGFDNSNEDIILFLDADLIGIREDDIETILNPVIEGNYDITISERGSGLSKYSRYLGFGQAFSGERAIKRKILAENKSIFNCEGYAIEAEMNKRFFGKYKIALVAWPNVSNPAKVERRGIGGIKTDIDMYKQIKTHIGMKELAKQMKFALHLPVLK